MTTDEFVHRVSAQPIITIEREVSIPGPQLKELLADGKPIMLTDFMSHPDQHRERRVFRYAHVLGAGLSANEVESWQARHPEHPLPEDLAAFLTRIDGVELWADLESSRAYLGILPMSEWQDAKNAGWATMFVAPPVGQLIISHHDNGDQFLVLNTQGPEYLWYDLGDFNHPMRVGSMIAEVLDFWWHETGWLDPRRSVGAD